MTEHKWPFPGEAPVARARKVALAYRAVALTQSDQLARYREALSATNVLQLIRFHDHDLADRIEHLLATTGTDPVAELDERFLQWGEKWHAEQPARDLTDDDWITSAEAGVLLNIASQSVNRARARGRIKGRWLKAVNGDPGRWVYQVRDVYALSRELRGRGWRAKDATVTVPDSRSSDTE